MLINDILLSKEIPSFLRDKEKNHLYRATEDRAIPYIGENNETFYDLTQAEKYYFSPGLHSPRY